MDKERIDDIICEIMINDGPDRHVDGHEVITNFIEALLKENGEEWFRNYQKELNKREKYARKYMRNLRKRIGV